MMKKIAFLFLLLVACTEKKTGSSETVLPPREFVAKYMATDDAILLDVRTEEEVAEGTLAQAQHIVYDASFSDKLEGLEKKPIFIYCASGIRSGKAAKILRDKGYDSVYELEAGLNGWTAAGLPIE